MDSWLHRSLEKIIEWRRRRDLFHNGVARVQWTDYHLSVLSSYVLELNLHSHTGLLCNAKVARLYPDLWLWSDQWCEEIVPYVMQDLDEFFTVPDLHLRKNELVSGFIKFLLQLLNHKTVFAVLFEDLIDDFERELRFLVTVLGDTSLICYEHEQIHDLLAKFEAVANEAGRLVHSFVFSMDPVPQSMNEGLALVFRNVGLLKDDIITFSPNLAKGNVIPSRAAVESLFIVDYVVSDIDDLLINQDDSRVVDVKPQIEILRHELRLSLSLLKDIKPLRHSYEMEELKDAELRIRDVAYEAEYLISSFLVGDAPLWYLSIRLPHVIHKIKLIATALKGIGINHQVLQVARTIISSQTSIQSKRNYEVADIVVGLEDVTTNILDQLVGGRERLQTISIFGMPGLGKTTLAKKLYNHPSVNYRFDKRSWSVVSQVYQSRNLLADILIGLTSEIDKDQVLSMDEEILVERIYKILKGRRYLIVMDDMWDSKAWDDLRRYFPDDGNGSRILFTSRNKDAAPPNSIICELPSLSDDQCWELLEKKVFRNECCCPLELESTGKEIAAKCSGLPLAVVCIAGILSSTAQEQSAWDEVRENVASYM